MRATAQTCNGTAAFQDGRARVSDFSTSTIPDFNDVRVSAGYGIPRSFYGDVDFDNTKVSGGGGTETGFGADLGYQIHLSDTPFQVCPSVMWQYESFENAHTNAFGFGGSLGYRVGISDWFALVPAAGIHCGVSETTTVTGTVNISGSPAGSASATQTSSQVFMTLGLVFNRALTINPGVIVPSQNGAKSIYTIGVSINWANAVPR